MAFIDNTQFVCIGPALYKHFTINGSGFTAKQAQFGKADQMIVSIARLGADILTGAGSGVLHRWGGGTAIKGVSPKLHTACIDAILVTPTHVLTGGRDSKICVLDAKTLA